MVASTSSHRPASVNGLAHNGHSTLIANTSYSVKLMEMWNGGGTLLDTLRPVSITMRSVPSSLHYLQSLTFDDEFLND